MTNTTCYETDGIQVCTPEDIQKVRNYALYGIAVLVGVATLGVLAANNVSVNGTELMGETINYFAP